MRIHHFMGAFLQVVMAAAALTLSACGSSAGNERAPVAATASEQTGPTADGTAVPASAATLATATAEGGCSAPSEPLPALTEGPYFREGSLERSSLIEPGTDGEKLLLSGTVYDADCLPLSGVLLDFWQADGNGVYDNAGFRLRGHQFTDSAGRYRLTTVVPGLYPGRTEHIHVIVETPSGHKLTTQLFFPDVQSNQTDGIFDDRLVIQMARNNEGWAGTFDFILAEP